MRIDYLKNEIEIGDTVVFPSGRSYECFDTAQVTGFTREHVRLSSGRRKKYNRVIVVKKVFENIQR